MLTISDVESYFNNTKNEFDIRKNKNARWIDQKCTPDVLCIVSDCILNYCNENNNEFKSTDIWHAEYTRENVEEIFSKPDTNEEKSKNEYDKFFAQPLELLAYSGVLSKKKSGRSNFYEINYMEILEFIALKEKNALDFIFVYINKVIKDSGIKLYFDEFLTKQNKDSFILLKSEYEKFIIGNTRINNVTEVRRIFTKVINPLAYKYKKRGTVKGRISKSMITYSMLMYNKENFRDINIDKPKNMTRKEWAIKHKKKVNIQYYKYQSAKSKKFIKKYNDEYRNGISEVVKDKDKEPATQIHHIFPQSDYPEISMYYENLIALTPNQHFIKAHPQNNTQYIDRDYQEVLLKAKAGIIEEEINAKGESSIYSFNNFIEVLNIGFNEKHEIEENDFIMVMEAIESYYR
ncbi:restriction endonuclease [Staphylococcus sp. SS87]|nr:restriction endonuclease [Staphylococcus singaporensis]